MKNSICLSLVLIVAAACRDKAGSADPRNADGSTKFDQLARPAETIVYASDGSVKHRTHFERDDAGRVSSSKTVGATGELKWTDQFRYTGTNSEPLEMQRVKANGETVLVQFRHSPDGTTRKIVVGPNGEPVSEADQENVLERLNQ